MKFAPATRERMKARLAIGGLSKSGKSYTSLAILRGLVGDAGRIAALDTEGTLHAYAGKFPGTKQPAGFDAPADKPTHFSPEVYIDAITSAAAAGYDGFLVDSASPEWEGTGGILDIVDSSAGDVGGKFGSGWRKATPQHRRLIQAILACPMHLVVTLRQEDAYVMTDNKPERVGMKLIQGKRFEYEFNLVATMDLAHTLRVQHSLIDFMPNSTVIASPDGLVLGQQIRAWLDAGEREWVAPQFKRAFYVNDREVVSAGIDRDTYVRCLNLGAALDKAAGKGTTRAALAAIGHTSLADLTADEGAKFMIELSTKVETARAKGR